MVSRRDSNNVSRLSSMRTTVTCDNNHDHRRWSLCSADGPSAYSTDQFDALSDLVSRTESILSNLNRKEPDIPATLNTDDLEYESDYGPPGGPIGRMPSRRFGSRRTRRHPKVSPFPLPEIKPLSVRRSGVKRTATVDMACSRQASVRADICTEASRSPIICNETFEEALAHMSETPIRPPPSEQSRNSTSSSGIGNSTTTTPKTRSISSAHGGRIDQKSPAPAFVAAEMVDIPITDEDSHRSLDRALSFNSNGTEKALPPYSAPLPQHRPGSSNQPLRYSSVEKEEKEGSVIHTLRLVVVALSLTLAVFVVGTNISIISPATPIMSQDVHSPKGTTWYISAYLMTLCAFQPLYGRMYAEYSAQWVFAAGLFVFEIASLIAAVSPVVAMLIFGRALQGVGAAGVLSGALFLGSLVAPITKRSMVAGFIGGVTSIAAISAPMLGSALAEHLNWRWCFYINMPICTVVIVVVLYCMRMPVESRPAQSGETAAEVTRVQRLLTVSRKLDLLGTLLLLTFVIALLLALQYGGRKHEWNSWMVILLFFAAIVSAIAFAYSQHKAADLALFPVRLLMNRTVSGSAWFMLCISAATIVIAKFIPLWFQLILDFTPAVAAVYLWPMLVGVVAGALISVAFVTATGHYAPLLIFGTVLMSVGAGLLTTWDGATSGSALLVTVPAIAGVGLGAVFHQPFIAVQAVLAKDDLPIGLSVVAFGQSLGASVAILISESLFANSLVSNIRERTGVLVSPNQALKFSYVRKMVLDTQGNTAKLTSAYNRSFTQAFILIVVMTALSILGCLIIKWRNVKDAERQAYEEEQLTLANEKQQQQRQQHFRSSNAPNPYSPRHNQASMAYNIIDNSRKLTSENSQQQQQQQQQQYYFELDGEEKVQNCNYELEATGPQPYDHSGSRKGSPYSRSRQGFGIYTTPTTSEFNRGPMGGSGPYYPSPYQIQRTRGLGLNSGNT